MAFNPATFDKSKYKSRTASSVPTPEANTVVIFLDSATGDLSQKNSSGNVQDLSKDIQLSSAISQGYFIGV
jgi:hypothetical protein